MMRDRIRLGLGSLRVFGDVWESARVCEKEAKRTARGVFGVQGQGHAQGNQRQTLEIYSSNAGSGARGTGGFEYSINGRLEGNLVGEMGSGGGGLGLTMEGGFQEEFGAGELEYLGVMNGLSMGGVRSSSC